MANTNNKSEDSSVVEIQTSETVVAQTETAIDAVTETETASATGAGWVVLLAVIVTFLLYRFGRHTEAARLKRWMPVFYAAVWGLAVLSITSLYAHGLDGRWKLVVWLVFLFCFFASLGWSRSIMSGVALAVEGRVVAGDSIRIDDVEGEVINFGLRSVSIRGIDGNIHEVPNNKFVSSTVVNLSAMGGDSVCDIYLEVPDSMKPSEALILAREVAILTPLASPRHRPEVFLEPTQNKHRRIRVRGYVFDPEYQEHFQSDVISRFSSLVKAETIDNV